MSGAGQGRGRGRGRGPAGPAGSGGRGGPGRGNANPRGRGGANSYRGRGRGGGWDPNARGGRGRGRGASHVQYMDDNFNAQQPRATPAAAAAASSSHGNGVAHSARFVRAVLLKCPPQKLTSVIMQSAAAWEECWQYAAQLQMEPLQGLLSALARIPFSSALKPPELHHICQAVKSMLAMADKTSNADVKAAAVELVEQVFHRLVKFAWPLERQDVETALTDMLASADNLLEARYPAHRKARERVSMLFEELEKSWTIKTVSTSETEDNALEEVPADPDWKHPTVGWLSDWNHFQPLKLPQMKVPGGQGDGIYDSPEQYFDVTIKLWIGMTFVDGNNALLPHCTAKFNEKICDQPLWPMFSRGSHGGRCRSKQCARTAEFMCCNRKHELGLCNTCAHERMQRLRGPASRNASTHIYDGNVVDIRHDGFIYLNQIECRRPPERPIHWKTTKRLSSPNLVGIVLLSGRDVSLRTSDDIYWAKVALHGDSFDEFKYREQGKLVVELLDYQGEDRENPLLSRGVQKGTSVAIIDCQTFVPEFVPVLMALERQSQMAMPFQNGAQVNLRRRIEHDFTAGIENNQNGQFGSDDEEASDTEFFGFSSQDVSHSTAAGLVEELINGSALDPIVQIRRNSAFRNRLLKELTQLVTQATLDSGQLESFLSALSFSVHCTQGPPGTGKSYLGVVVVRALLIIRKLWMQLSPSIGSPPILVLSYKNHAIDEFLLDLVHKEPVLGHIQNARNYSGFRQLIRLGGGCNEPDLQPYMERNAMASAPIVKKIGAEITSYHELQDLLRSFQNKFAVVREARLVILDPEPGSDADTQKKNRKVCYDAAATIQEAGSVITVLSSALQSQNEQQESDELDENEPGILAVVSETLTEQKVSTFRYEDIRVLYNGIRHYDETIAVGDILHKWISGFVPRPQCAYNEECKQIADETSLFCVSHRCKYEHTTSSGQCDRSTVSKKPFCVLHSCNSSKCLNARLRESEVYCEEHACFICLDSKNGIANEATDDPPRNTCELHPLCWADDADMACTNIALSGSSYCKIHAQKICKGITVNGDTCKERAISLRTPYCAIHANQNPDIIATDEKNAADFSTEMASANPSGRCQAKNAKGKPCGTPPLVGFSYCRVHQEKAALIPVQVSIGTPDESGIHSPRLTEEKNQDEETTHETELTESEQLKPSEEFKSESVDESSFEYDDCEHVDVESSSSGSYFDVDCVNIDDEDDIEESEHLQHLREVDEVQNAMEDDDDDSDNDELAEEEEAVDLVFSTDAAIVHEFIPVGEWNWEMDLQLLRAKISASKKHLRLEKIKAKAKAYEGKAIIGGTITGCVARLDAIRATNPFAILVEEASEVLEPLLFSCLGSTTCKLEMIGDHLQLQPSVMSKFDFERVNKINISMFERLIRAPVWNAVPSSILSIQRRMRKNICDLTREFYRDITDIEDHAVCSTKTIVSAPLIRSAASKRTKNAVNLLDHCAGNGREVPGVLPHLFFWEHSGAEERAKVGLSRINTNEAKMVCQLAKYMVECGVPSKSIAILTPYKGQLMLIRNMLMREYGLAQMSKPAPGFQHGKPSPACTVSTVDRFQGDEADVVIVSLVIDGKSKTPFVKLQNRMIVLLSRARIGMYIVGNTKYFGETSHWQETFDLLEEPAASDNASILDRDCVPFSGARLGRELPICCPQHRQSTTLAKLPKDLKLNFCNVKCEEMLSCTHQCGLRCHWPKINQHKADCDVKIDSPCPRYPRVMKCSYFCGSTNVSDISRALKAYQCDEQVELQLPCTHTRILKCYDVQRYGGLPTCVQQSIKPYQCASCKHDLNCSCDEFHKYSTGQPPPPCTDVSAYTPRCGHTVFLMCYLRMQYISNPSRFAPPCMQVSEYVPSCGHGVLIKCYCEIIISQIRPSLHVRRTWCTDYRAVAMKFTCHVRSQVLSENGPELYRRNMVLCAKARHMDQKTIHAQRKSCLLVLAGISIT